MLKELILNNCALANIIVLGLTRSRGLKNPFWVNDMNQLEEIINAGVKEICIETSKGLDVLPAPIS
jgi:hypothetical protein